MKMNMCVRVSLVVLVIMMILPAMPTGMVTEDAEAQVSPDVSVSVDPGLLSIDVSPTGTGIAQSTIYLENTGAHQVSCDVEVQIEGYEASPSQVSITLAPFTTRTLPMAIVAELRSPYQTQAGMVICTVKSIDFVPLDNMFINTAGFQVWTIPYAKIIIDAEDPLLKVWPGKTTKLKFNVLNEGNNADEIRLEVENKVELYRKGFSIALESSGSTLINPREMLRMNIHITTPKSTWEDNYYTIDVKAVSSYDTNQKFTYSVTVWVRGVYVPGFDPLPALISLFVVAGFLSKRKNT